MICKQQLDSNSSAENTYKRMPLEANIPIPHYKKNIHNNKPPRVPDASSIVQSRESSSYQQDNSLHDSMAQLRRLEKMYQQLNQQTTSAKQEQYKRTPNSSTCLVNHGSVQKLEFMESHIEQSIYRRAATNQEAHIVQRRPTKKEKGFGIEQLVSNSKDDSERYYEQKYLKLKQKYKLLKSDYDRLLLTYSSNTPSQQPVSSSADLRQIGKLKRNPTEQTGHCDTITQSLRRLATRISEHHATNSPNAQQPNRLARIKSTGIFSSQKYKSVNGSGNKPRKQPLGPDKPHKIYLTEEQDDVENKEMYMKEELEILAKKYCLLLKENMLMKHQLKNTKLELARIQQDGTRAGVTSNQTSHRDIKKLDKLLKNSQNIAQENVSLKEEIRQLSSDYETVSKQLKEQRSTNLYLQKQLLKHNKAGKAGGASQSRK